jgi:AcrR family transcriptional regulator
MSDLSTSAGPGGQGGTPKSDREKIIDAFMALLAERSIEDIQLSEIAERAEVSLAQLRGEFGSKLEMVAAHIKAIDRAVLAGGDYNIRSEPPRDRLFDVLMRRLEALAPYKAAVHSLMRSAARNPTVCLALNACALRSQKFMLQAAGIRVSGVQGFVRMQGMAALFGDVLRVWVHDDDPGLARTMAVLDGHLARGQRWSGLLDDLCAVPAALCRARSWRSRRRVDQPGGAAAA